MNRYILQGIAEDLRQNKQVVLFTSASPFNGALTHMVADHLAPGYVKRVTQERVLTQGGGSLHVFSYRDSVDRVRGMDPDVMLRPALAYSEAMYYLERMMTGELIEY